LAERPDRLTALAVRNFRLYFVGQVLSNVGTWFQMLAQGLLVLKLTGSAAALGAVTALQNLPLLLFGAWAGVVIDRVNVRRLLIITSALAGVQALVLGIVTGTGHVTVWWVMALAFPLGLVQMFDRPGGQAFLPQIVERELIPSAVAFNSVILSSGRLAGPAIAGLVYAWKGPATCFYVNAISYAVISIALLLIRRRELIPRHAQPRASGQLRDGLRFVWRSPLHRDTLIANAVIGCLAFNFPTVYASMVTFVFHAGGSAFGAAESTNAAFAVLGGLVLARRLRAPTGRTFVIACFALGATLTANGLAPNLAAFIACMPFFGLAAVSYQTVAQSLLQQNTPNELIGRVMALFNLGTQGTTPIGALITGWVTDTVSARASLGLGAASLWISGSVLGIALLRARRRQRGVAPTPEPADGETVTADPQRGGPQETVTVPSVRARPSA
jgi:MFS family permease